MDATEREIYYFLKANRPEFITMREISRRTGSKRRRRVSPDWAVPVLEEMVRRGILEKNEAGDFHLKPIPRPDTTGKVWVAPGLAHLLKASGKKFDDRVLTAQDEDEYYDKL
jgi:hypothetical protein